MKATHAMMVMMLFLGGCGSCEPTGTAPTGGEAPAPNAAPPAAANTPEAIRPGGVEPKPAGEPPKASTPVGAAGAPQQPPQAAAPEPESDEDDCIVIADANPDYGTPPLTVEFSAEAECSGGEPKYVWDFGDGSPPSNQVNPSHTYAKTGDYTATVTVTGRGDISANDEIDITVEEDDEDGELE